MYVSDSGNNRVMKWMEGAKEGIVVAGGQGEGNSLRQLSYPRGVVVDQLDTVYVADLGNASNHTLDERSHTRKYHCWWKWCRRTIKPTQLSHRFVIRSTW